MHFSNCSQPQHRSRTGVDIGGPEPLALGQCQREGTTDVSRTNICFRLVHGSEYVLAEKQLRQRRQHARSFGPKGPLWALNRLGCSTQRTAAVVAELPFAA